jgi:hypothetical protein
MPIYLELLFWLLMGSIALFFVGVLGLPFIVVARRLVSTPSGVAVVDASLTGGVVENDPIAVGTLFLAPFALVPVLLIALWALVLEIRAGSVGPAFALSLVHVYLLWRLLDVGAHIQRRIEIAPSVLVSVPVRGPRRELVWTTITRVEEVRYIGPGVSGLYVRSRAPQAEWRKAVRGILIA